MPNARMLACVIDAWANAGTVQERSFAPERAEAVLNLAILRRRDYVNSAMGRVREEEEEEEEEEEKESTLFIDQ